jgi:MFS family permease
MSTRAWFDFEGTTTAHGRVSSRYSYWVLVVLTLVYLVNFIDRNILSILAEDIRADLGVSDASLGFLYGTVFAVFYAVFGIPLGRLADAWVRTKLISIGLALWSAMTALSGTANAFGSLAAYRVGVGVGESSATPAAFSLLQDYFPTRLRATAIAFYSSGLYIGGGIGIAVGGLIVDRWNAAYTAASAPFGLAGWQVAFFVVGLPGLLLALVVWMLKEPARGQREGIDSAESGAHPLATLSSELATVIPPLTIVSLVRAGGGRAAVARNLAWGVVIALAAWGLTILLGSPGQWIALGLGCYSAVSWSQALRLRDPVAFELIFRSKAIMLGVAGFSMNAFVAYIVTFWAAPFFIRVHGVSAGTTGLVLGLTAATSGWLAANWGGLFSDWLKQRNGKARLYVGILCALIMTPFQFAIWVAPTAFLAFAINVVATLFRPIWLPSAGAMVNELVLPRMRATVSAFYLMGLTFIGLALGPYAVGAMSDALTAGGSAPSEALRTALIASLAGYGVAIALLLAASRYVEEEEAGRLERARALGEAV